MAILGLRDVLESQFVPPVPLEQWPYARRPDSDKQLGGLAVVGEQSTGPDSLVPSERIAQTSEFDELDYVGLVALQAEAAELAYESIWSDPGRVLIQKPTRERSPLTPKPGESRFYWAGSWEFGSWRVGYREDTKGNVQPIASLFSMTLLSHPDRPLLEDDMQVPDPRVGEGGQFFPEDDRQFFLDRLRRTDYELKRVDREDQIPSDAIRLDYEGEAWYIDYQQGRGGRAAEVQSINNVETVRAVARHKVDVVLRERLAGDDTAEQRHIHEHLLLPEMLSGAIAAELPQLVKTITMVQDTLLYTAPLSISNHPDHTQPVWRAAAELPNGKPSAGLGAVPEPIR